MCVCVCFMCVNARPLESVGDCRCVFKCVLGQNWTKLYSSVKMSLGVKIFFRCKILEKREIINQDNEQKPPPIFYFEKKSKFQFN